MQILFFIHGSIEVNLFIFHNCISLSGLWRAVADPRWHWVRGKVASSALGWHVVGNNHSLSHMWPPPSYLSNTAGLHWPWPLARPVPACPGSAGTVCACRWMTYACVCRPGPTAWRGQMSMWPETPSGATPGGRKAPSHLVCLAKAWRPTCGRHEEMVCYHQFQVNNQSEMYSWVCRNTPVGCSDGEQRKEAPPLAHSQWCH